MTPGTPSSMRGAVRVPLRVRFSETDAVGVANNAAYLSWFEVGRIEFLRARGRSYREVHDGGMDMVVTEASLRYVRPLRFDDEFDVVCACTEVRRSSFSFGYALERDGAEHARGTTRHACIDSTSLRPTRVPAWLTDLVAEDAA